jgi:lipopolysaccharide export system permease protein
MTLLDRYIARTLLSAVGLVMAALLMLGMLFVFIGEQGSVGVGHYSMLDALLYAAMSLPQFAVESFPAGALIGALMGIGIFARSNELTVMRASGMSKLRLSVSVLISSAVLIGIAVLIGEFLAQPLAQLADAQKAFAKYSNVSFAAAGGAWVRDGDTILNVQGRSSAAEFGGMLIFELTKDNRLLAIGRADRANATGPQSWQLSDYSESRFTDDNVTSLHAPTCAPPPERISCSSPPTIRRSSPCISCIPGSAICAPIIWRRGHTKSPSGRASPVRWAFWRRCCSRCRLVSARCARPH